MGLMLVLSQVLAVTLSRPENKSEEKALTLNLPLKSIKPKITASLLSQPITNEYVEIMLDF